MHFVKQIKDNKKTILVIVFFLLLVYGTFIRIYGLGSDSFWIDESMSALAAKKIHESGNPVLESGFVYDRALVFHNIMSFFLMFGYNEFNARLVSVIFGIASCVLIFFIAKEYNKHTAWIAFIFSLFLEIFIVYSRQARMYQMEMFFFFLTLFLLYKGLKSKKFIWWSLLAFLFAYNTHPISLLLIPFFFYVLLKNKMNKFIYIISGILGLYLIYSQLGRLDEFRLFYLKSYIFYLKYYLPFIVLSLIGIALSWKKKLTWFLGLSAFFIITAGTLNKTFAFRYVYIICLPLVILAAVTLSRIKFRWFVVGIYLVWVSNIFFPFTYVSILIPEKQISHIDITEPSADFRNLYSDLEKIYNGEKLVVSFTPAAEWYFEKPNYWIYFSFSGVNCANNSCSTYNDKEIYTGAEKIYDLDDFKRIKNKIVVLDYWGAMHINLNITKFISKDCVPIINKKGVTAFRCLDETVANNSSKE